MIFEFVSENKLVLPIHYNHILQGLIYHSFSDRTLADFLHNNGYQLNKRKFKLFSFSRLMGDFIIDNQNKQIIFESPVKFVVTSVKPVIIQDITSNIIKNNYVRIGKEHLFLKEVKFESFNVESNKMYIKMLSPVVTYKTYEANGSKKTHYYSPWEPEFEEQIKNNLLKKYELVEGKKPDNLEFSIKPLFKKETAKPNIILYRDFVIKGWSGIFELSGDLKLLKIAYDIGIGAKNSLGFGCFEILTSKSSKNSRR
ncbi:CRISPR-associated endoribonuclease Cas6 [Anoxybacter fermentans]|uniref:CRISPR-associated endoribonuclease Cas6 n=1 Tax=Anoxybacter fermentans TaxID=1323375 RepID=UPI001EFF832A|nr:CRISPR-associated endoribonuclease Cas6 [Anoxybacter fermentans]